MGKPDQGSAEAEGARRATGAVAGRGRGGRFSARRKRETVLRLLSMATENCTLLATENCTLRGESCRAERTFSR